MSKFDPYPGYDLYEYFPDHDVELKNKSEKATLQHKLNVENGGMPQAKAGKETNGRRIKPRFSMAK